MEIECTLLQHMLCLDGSTASAYIFRFSLQLLTEVVIICMDPAGNWYFIALGFLGLTFLEHLQFIGL